ncbi:MAG: 50S ribosomal protein L17 [Bacteroidota bacterium]
MIHARKGRKLNRTASHRKALLSALSTSLLRHKRIKTTLAKAKETRMVVEKLITRAKNAVAKETDGAAKNIHARREVAKFIHDKLVVKELFNEIAPKVAARAGGYTRVIKLGQRLGDGAHVALLELVDYGYQAETPAPVKKKQDRKARISQKKKTKTEAPAAEQPAGETAEK